MHPKIIRTAGLIVVQNNQLLLAFSKNKNAWYLPGGKVDAGENSLDALRREIREELNIELDTQRLQYYYHITAPAYGENNVMMEQDCFSYTLTETIKPGKEIAKVKWFNPETYNKEPAQVVGVLTAFQRLTLDGILK